MPGMYNLVFWNATLVSRRVEYLLDGFYPVAWACTLIKWRYGRKRDGTLLDSTANTLRRRAVLTDWERKFFLCTVVVRWGFTSAPKVVAS